MWSILCDRFKQEKRSALLLLLVGFLVTSDLAEALARPRLVAANHGWAKTRRVAAGQRRGATMMVVKDSSMEVQFKVGDRVTVTSADVSRQGSALDGLSGTVAEVGEKCDVDPARAVTVHLAFGEFGDRKGYQLGFAEDELAKVPPNISERSASNVVAEADKVLGDYNLAHMRAAKEGGLGLGGGISANEFADACDVSSRRLLRGSIQAMLDPTKGGSCDRVTLGICAPSAEVGVAALKQWVTALDLPRGALHGMDFEGTAIQVEGPVYIKYNSGTRTFEEVRNNNGIAWRPGDAFLNKYDGDYRGVGFVAHLPAGNGEGDENSEEDDDDGGSLKQYAYLPLDLF
eukprot:CAMPEP_0171907482 /NCGR_PEP_ID=MMETSP0993-20121228/6992_1 /TAXON_ID=483369 /ORGANISM="non described non described, Strain CCMP2098" /LENGTH=344 /DNA_ID=CAMNT_0012539719 /DNA_START=52 /DNA_END=1086 /DNA_ORIENTATION=-